MMTAQEFQTVHLFSNVYVCEREIVQASAHEDLFQSN